MASGAAVLFKLGGLVLFIWCAIHFFYLGNHVHRGKQGDASFEVLADFFSLISESELSAPTQGMAVFASVVVEDIRGQLVWALFR